MLHNIIFIVTFVSVIIIFDTHIQEKSKIPENFKSRAFLGANLVKDKFTESELKSLLIKSYIKDLEQLKSKINESNFSENNEKFETLKLNIRELKDTKEIHNVF